jgi:serine protease AprX
MKNRRLPSLGLAFALACLFVLSLALSVRSAAQEVFPAAPANVAAQVWEATAGGGGADFLVILAGQADVSPAAGISDREARLRHVYDVLRKTAYRSQAPLRAELDRAGVAYRPFYIVNMLAVDGGDRALVARLAGRPDVARIDANPSIRQPLPEPGPEDDGPLAPQGIEWGVARVSADDVWDLGITGQGIVVAGQDTGYEWTHPALIDRYRGWDGLTATHDYNWHDAIHSGGGVCGADSPEPCDDYSSSHGTHTMGTIVGDDGGTNQIGVAPGAQWIGCRNMDQGVGSPATYAECFEFFLAPYPVGGDPMTDGVPGLAPHLINNSWTCPTTEGCAWDTLQDVVENVRAAGILVVASAGNDGSACSTVREPIALYDAVFSVGATDSSDTIAGFSGRGPVTIDGSNRLKPDVSAPGVSVRSSVRGGGYASLQGTSMAGPHVAGAVALLWSAAPGLIGDLDATEWIVERTARPRTTAQGCGGDGPDDVPNNVYGWGIVDALAALARIEVAKTASPAVVSPGDELTYTLRVTNTGGVTLTAMITDELPSPILPGVMEGGTAFVPDGTLVWTPVVLPPGDVWTEMVAVTVELGYAGWLTNVVRVTTDLGVTATHTTRSATPMPALAIDKRASSVVALPGEPLTYTLRLTNTGNVPLTGIVTDVLPSCILPGMTEGGTAFLPGGTLTWTLPPLAPEGVWTETVVVTVEAGYIGWVTNVVRAATAEGAAGVYTHVLPTGPAITKRAGDSLVSPGSLLVYTIDVTNTSSLTLTEVVVTDVVPPDTIFAWADGDHVHAGGMVTWTAASLASQDSLTATVAVTVERVPPDWRIVNGEYGVRAAELPASVKGLPVETAVAWRLILPIVLRDSTALSRMERTSPLVLGGVQ